MVRRIAVILAGGRSARMGGRDKALVELGGIRLIDRVIARLAPQADRMAISGRRDYGTGLAAIADEKSGPQGPAAGIFAVSRWMAQNEPSTEGFFTAPVDGPFLPDDLAQRLGARGGPAVAADDGGIHPTFVYWTLPALEGAWEKLRGAPSVSLRALASASKAAEVRWPGTGLFFNINSPEDLSEAAIRQDRERSSS